MKVCHITTVHRSTDERIFFKECVSLKHHGYEVCLIAPEKGDGIENIPVYVCGTYKSRWKRFWQGGRNVLRLARKTEATLFHFHDPELMPVGLILRLSGKKVVYDVHEDLPRQVLYKNWIRCSIVRILSSWLIKILEKIFVLFFNRVVAATDDIAKKFPSSKTTTVKNYPSLKLISEARLVPFDKRTYTILYAGGISKIRGIREAIQALDILDGKVEMILLGSFDEEDYKILCMQERGWKYVHHFGWRPLFDVYGFMNVADAGLATLYPARNFLKSLPVKAFEYMACGLPLVVSGFPFWREVFGSCSVFVDPQSPESIAEGIKKLANDGSLAGNLGNAGKEMVLSEYSWEKEQEKLFLMYDQILKNGS